jgi:hypothetical protein
MAQAAEGITDAYRAGVAAVECNLNLSSETSSALGDAVQRVEQASGMSQNQLDSLWKKLTADAKADNAAFCADAAVLVDQTIASAAN